ncbi:beta strand repeat-containing protein [Lactiplantibacillus plantarum]|uniref:beta strand repeat-containing protein n=1 Tax=Lactiplantibacillus plantarum TaxID=1590 RepID=UPI003218CEA1
MAESNATQVILTDDGIKIIKAQNTADNAAGGVTNLNDPNLMSVIEKQTQAAQYTGLTSQYNVILKRAKDANVSTTALTTAYTRLNTFMTAILTDTTKASDVDRDTYKGLTDDYNIALSNVQTALSNSFNTDIDNMQSSVSVASQAASSAVIVASQAAITGDNANQVASRAIVVANDAQTAGNNATSIANNASQAASSAILVGSTATVNASKAISVASQAQIAGNNATSVANNASQAASSAILAGSTATVSANKASTAASQAQIAGDNATSVANNATSVASNATSVADNALSQAQAVGSQASADIVVQSAATAKAQSTADSAFSQAVTAIDTGQAVSQAVTSLKDGSTLTIAELGNGLASKVSNSEYASYKDQTASQIGEMVTDGAFSAYQQTTKDLISSKVATSDFSSYKDETAKEISSKVATNDFNTYKTQTADTLQTLVSRSPSNIIKDGGFNSAVVGKILSGWDFSGTAQIATNSDKINGLVATGHPVLQINSKTSGNSDIYYGDWFDVQPGDQFYAELKTRWSSTSQKGQIVLGVVTKDATGKWIWTGAVTVGSPSTWTKHTGVLTIPAGAVQGRVWVAWQWSAAANESVFVTDLVVRPAYSTQSDITQTINNIHLGFKNPDGSNFQMNLSANGVALLDFSKIMLNGSTNITNGTIGTAQIANGAITNAKIANLAVGTAQIANGAITNAQIGSEAVGTAQIKDAAISSAKIANLAVGTAQIGDGAITNAKIGSLAVGTAQIANGAITDAKIGSLAVGTAQIKDAAISSAKIANLAVGTAQIGDGAITNAKIGKLAVGTAQIANAAITDAQVGNVSANKLTAGTIDFNTITGKNINASNITTGTLDTNRLNVGKLSALSANLGDVTTGSLKGVDIVAKTFSTPNGSFTTDANGAITAKNMTLIGGTLTSPTINASTINGSTINGTTFNAGTQLNSYGNTSYPLTISSDGSVESTTSQTYSGITDILRTRLRNGQLNTNFRRMNPYETGKYLAADTTLGIGQLSLYEGYSTSADANFSVNSLKATGYTILDAGTGLSLHGSTQGINFGGADLAQTTGITMNSYGNIIGYPNSTWWRIVSNSGSNVANFGIDRGGSNVIQFNRELDIGNFQINTGHTFTSADGGAIHFAKGRGGANDIYAGAVHYTSLVKSSLLSVKKDVKKADTSYWAQLVNSIDLATYQYKTDDNTSHIRLSSIVDDVHDTKQWQLPDVFVSRDEDGKLCGVDDSVLLNATLATVQEQQKEIDQLNGHNMELEARLNKLEAKLNG